MSRLICLVAYAWATWAAAGAAPNSRLSQRNGLIPSLSGNEVSITAGQSGTYPRANFLNNGSIIGAYTGSNGSNNILTLVHSNDNGSSWAEIGTAASRPTDSSDLDNPYPLQLPSGRVLLAYRNHDKVAGSQADYTTFRITISYSDDNGTSWLWLTDAISYAGSQYHGVWEPFLRQAQDGSLQLYYSFENEQNDQDSLLRTSTDGGQSWSDPKTISGQDVTARDGMLGVATVDGSNLIAVFESVDTTDTNLFTVHSITSADDGATWGNRQLVYQPNGTDTNAGAPQVINVGSTVCVSFMTDEDTQERNWTNGAAAKLLTSGDGGQTWGSKTEVFPVQANWPGLLDLDSSSFLYLADHNGAASQEITLS